jgi:TonB family protein
VPSDARALFCDQKTPGEAWIAALTPLKRPDKANAELIVVHVHAGEEHSRKRNVLARDSWRRPAWTHDFDGDGHDELVLSVDRPNDQLLRYREGSIEPYPRPGQPIERFEDANGDGRLDPVFRLASPTAYDCQGNSVDLSRLQAGITHSDGRFAVDHESVRERLRVACPAPPSGSFAAPSSQRDAGQRDASERIRCARLWGMSGSEATDKVLSDCRPFRAQALTCEGPCRDLEVLLASASNDPPVRLAPERPHHQTPVAAPSGTLPPGTLPPGTLPPGTLPPEVIQQAVRQRFARFRLCYEGSLRNSPNLQGRVTVRFVIGRDGTVTSASSSGSDIPDRSVTDCVVRAVYGLSFPKPEGGAVTVTYPIVFTPGG